LFTLKFKLKNYFSLTNGVVWRTSTLWTRAARTRNSKSSGGFGTGKSNRWEIQIFLFFMRSSWLDVWFYFQDVELRPQLHCFQHMLVEIIVIYSAMTLMWMARQIQCGKSKIAVRFEHFFNIQRTLNRDVYYFQPHWMGLLSIARTSKKEESFR
jgi:hypothetical protein